MSDDDVYRTAKCFGDGLQGVEAYGIFASLYSADVVTLHSYDVGKPLLIHTFFFAEVSNALTYPLSFFFFAHSSLFLPVVANHRVRVLDYSVRAVVGALA